MNFSRLLCSVALLLNASLVLALGFKISDIRINGLQRVSAGSVFGALPLNVGDEADDRRLVDSTRALFKTGFFQDIQLSREGDVLIINVVERPSVASIEFEGNKAISTDDLMKGMKQSGLAEGEIFQRPRWKACATNCSANMLPRAATRPRSTLRSCPNRAIAWA